MMKYLICLAFSLCTLQLSAQVDTTTRDTIRLTSENMGPALFPGGDDSLMAYLKRSIIYPEKSKKKNHQGLVIISFIVEKDGSISTIRAEKEVENAPLLTEEAIRIVKAMPKWKPAGLDGRAVRAKCTVPVRFTLHN